MLDGFLGKVLLFYLKQIVDKIARISLTEPNPQPAMNR